MTPFWREAEKFSAEEKCFSALGSTRFLPGASYSATLGCAPAADRGLTFPGAWCLNFISAKAVADSQTLAWLKTDLLDPVLLLPL